MRASIANHWWGFDEGRKKMHWKSWNWLTAPKSLGGLGFRDFVMFNQAITEPSSLCARVLKGRYFPNSDFLSAVKPRSSSFTWRSILYGRELLLRGLRWGIGNGERVSIMKDSWIPDHQAGMFNSLSPIPATAKVRFLMNDRGTAWEEDSVRAFFHEELADKILGVPISRLGGEDFVSWPFDKHGVYSVKSGYNLAKTSAFFADREARGKGSSSDLGAETVLWKAVWAIKAPEKMKVVLWRIIHDCLPTGQQLVHRHIPADDCCLFCGQLEACRASIPPMSLC
jgi:hypothetical protein